MLKQKRGSLVRETSQASNRHADNVVFNIVTRLQAKKLEHNYSLISTLREQESIVSKASANVPAYEGTTIHTSYISTYCYAWQLHLKRISPFLTCGEGIWWSKQSGAYCFHDGGKHLKSQQLGPPLLHFRNTKLQDIQTRNDKLWEDIITKKITIPTTAIRIFDKDGNLKEIRDGEHVHVHVREPTLSSDQNPSTSSLRQLTHMDSSVLTQPPLLNLSAHPSTSTAHLPTSTAHPSTSTAHPPTSAAHPSTSAAHPPTCPPQVLIHPPLPLIRPPLPLIHPPLPLICPPLPLIRPPLPLIRPPQVLIMYVSLQTQTLQTIT